MKKVVLRIKNILTFLLVCLSMACSGEDGMDGVTGPQGPAGMDGVDGASVEVVGFDATGVNFTSLNNRDATVQIPIPDSITFTENDIPFAFLRDPVTPPNEDIWEALPRTFFFSEGYAQYWYKFSFEDGSLNLEVVLESDDFSTLASDFTENQSIRVIIVPASFETGAELKSEEILNLFEKSAF